MRYILSPLAPPQPSGMPRFALIQIDLKSVESLLNSWEAVAPLRKGNAGPELLLELDLEAMALSDLTEELEQFCPLEKPRLLPGGFEVGSIPRHITDSFNATSWELFGNEFSVRVAGLGAGLQLLETPNLAEVVTAFRAAEPFS